MPDFFSVQILFWFHFPVVSVNSLLIQIFYYDFQPKANKHVILFQVKRNGTGNDRETKDISQCFSRHFNRTLQKMTYTSHKTFIFSLFIVYYAKYINLNMLLSLRCMIQC